MAVKGQPTNLKKEAEKDENGDDQSRRQNFFKRNSASLAIAAAFLIPNFSAIVWPYMRTLWNHETDTTSPLASSNTEPFFEPHVPVESHQRVSLFEKYAVNYAEVMRIRKENMKKYAAYEYNMFGIDRRSNLSLQEYRDVYDGKW